MDMQNVIENRIIAEVAGYYKQWKLPFAVEMLSKTYSKQIKEHVKDAPSFTEFVEQMNSDEKILLRRTMRGKKVLLPFTAELKLQDDTGELMLLLTSYDKCAHTRRRIRGDRE